MPRATFAIVSEVMHRRRPDPVNRRYPVRLVMVATLIALFLLPSLALAADGSDTSAFERYASQSPIVAAGMSFAFGFISALEPLPTAVTRSAATPWLDSRYSRTLSARAWLRLASVA